MAEYSSDRQLGSDNFGLKYSNKYAYTSVLKLHTFSKPRQIGSKRFTLIGEP